MFINVNVKNNERCGTVHDTNFSVDAFKLLRNKYKLQGFSSRDSHSAVTLDITELPRYDLHTSA